MSRYAGSDFYCLPDSLVLRNLANIDNQEELDAFEADITAVRIFEYTEAPLSGRFDLNHLCQIHHYVFQDVFDWAGQLRMVDISKGDSRFANFGLIDSYLGGVLAEIEKQNFLKNCEPETFVERLAFYMSEINAAHPFREGNGRVQRLFCSQLGEAAGYFLDFDAVSKEETLQAMIAAFRGHELLLRNLLARITSRIRN